VDEAATGASLLRRREDKQALDRGDFPSLKSLLALKSKWDTDDFGRETLLHYAAAESLFVHLMTDPARRAIVDRFIAAVQAERDPAECLSADEAASLEKGWLAFVAKSVR
jgi:hypothetical protein